MTFKDLEELQKEYVASNLKEDENIYVEYNVSKILEGLKKENKQLRQKNQELKKQLEYLRSGEYLNQLKFERNMLQDIVDNSEVSKEDKQFIDMTHRNTKLLSQQKEFIEYLENEITKIEKTIELLSVEVIE